jgi:hypothetical protein
MDANQKVRYTIRSTNASISAAEIVSALVDDASSLNESFRAEHPAVSFEISREDSVPLDWNTAVLIVDFVAAPILAGALQALGEDLYRLLKRRIKDGTVEPDRGNPEG